MQGVTAGDTRPQPPYTTSASLDLGHRPRPLHTSFTAGGVPLPALSASALPAVGSSYHVQGGDASFASVGAVRPNLNTSVGDASFVSSVAPGHDGGGSFRGQSYVRDMDQSAMSRATQQHHHHTTVLAEDVEADLSGASKCVLAGILLFVVITFALAAAALASINSVATSVDEVVTFTNTTGATGVVDVSTRTWRLAVGPNFAPWDFTDPTGNQDGLNKAIASRVCQEMDMPCVFVTDKYANCWSGNSGGDGLLNGNYDGCVGWFATTARRNTFTFSDAWGNPTPGRLFSRQAGAAAPTTLANRVLGVVDGYATTAGCLAANGMALGTQPVRTFASQTELNVAVAAGVVDYGFTFVSESIDGLHFVGAAYTCGGGLSLMARKDNPVVAAFNVGLAKIKNSGVLNSLCTSYNANSACVSVSGGGILPTPHKEKQWVIAVGNNFSPYDALDMHGNIAGLNMEMVTEVCAAAGLSCAVAVDKYSNCWSEGAGGEGLMSEWYVGCAGWYQTTPRQQVFRFSDAWAPAVPGVLIAQQGTPFTTDFRNDNVGFTATMAADAACLRANGNILPEASVQVFASDADTIAAVTTGAVKYGFIFDSTPTGEALARLRTYSCTGGMALMSRKSDHGFVAAFDRGLQLIRSNGKYSEVCARYPNGSCLQPQ